MNVEQPTRCEWFALGENDATHDEPHPVLGSVPCCDRCAAVAADAPSETAEAQL